MFVDGENDDPPSFHVRERMICHAVRPTVFVVMLSLAALGSPVQAQDEPTPAQARDPIAVAREFGLVPLDEFDSHVCNYMQSAEDGLPDAQWTMGRAYEHGRWGVTQHDQMSAQWYRLAAEQGHAEAQERLGDAYAAGRGVAKDEM